MMDSFVFYKSFYEAIAELPNEYRLEIYEVICQYSLYGEVPEMSGITKALFTLMKANIDATEKKYRALLENGKKGGRPKKEMIDEETETELKPNDNQTITKAKPNDNQTITKPKPNRNLNYNYNLNENKDFNYNDNVITAESSDEFPAETKTDEETAVAVLPLLDGTDYPISQTEVEGWKKAYPAVDILQELHKMKSWLEANPKNRKSFQGIKRFIVNWLSRSQDRAKKLPNAPPSSEPGFDLEEFFNAAIVR